MIRVVIADDQRAVREGLAMLVALTDDIQVVGTAANGVEAVQLASELHADEMLVAVTGQPLARHTRANYLRDKPFAGRFDPNQRFAGLEK